MSVSRISALRKKIKSENLDGLVVNHLDHIRYLSGFSGSSGLLIVMQNAAHFLTDSRYTIQAARQVKGAKVYTVKSEPISSLNGFKWLQHKNLKLGIDSEHLSVAKQKALQKKVPGALLTESESLLADLGWVKDSTEIKNIKKACEIADKAFARILQLVKPGVSERELAAELEYQMLMLGSEKPAFESIVASGYRSAMPHGLASAKKVKKGDFITFDFGATVNGYVSDMTRTVVLGKASSRQKKIYNIVLRAQKAGVKKIRAGIAAKQVDKACRDIIVKAGYGKKFGHGTGHGIGYYVHVGPRLSPKSDDSLAVNQVVTVEPGIYISGWGGVRIEDDVVVTRNGGKVLNKTLKNLLEL
ncbi:MAG: aminopeptidase P family protein [candidate division Zixibacteria bacterium]|nr:aminopeptidase P family protein [candidate division Zixibacteria bacterium]